MLNQNEKVSKRDEIIQQIKKAGNTTNIPLKAIITLLPTGEIKEINPSAKKILKTGFLHLLKVSGSIYPLIPTSQLSIFNEQLQEVLSSGITNSEKLYIGEKSKYHLSLVPVFDKQGNSVLVNILISPVLQLPPKIQIKSRNFNLVHPVGPLKTNEEVVKIAPNITTFNNYEEEQKFIHRLLRALGKTSGHRKSLQKTIRMMAEFFGFSVAEAWEVGFDKENIRKVAEFYKNKGEVWDNNKGFFKKNLGLPGITWKSKKSQIWPDLQNEKRFQRLDSIRGSEIFMGVGVPVILKNEVITVLVFFGAKDKVQINLKKILERVAIQLATEVKRKMTENQLNNMFEFSPNLIAVIGIDGYLKKVNPAFFKIFGYTEDELLKTRFTEFLHPDEKGNTYERLKEVAGGLVPRPFQNRCLSKSGEWRWISWTPSDLIEEEGIVHLFGIDITPIKTLNLELLQYRNLIESLNDGVVFISLDPERVILNSAFKKIVGFPQDREYSRSDLEKLYGNKKTARRIFSTLLAGDYFEGDVQLKSKGGEMLDFNLRGGPVLSEKGELIAVFGLHTDISERKRYETSLKAYGNRITNILESITDGFFSLNNDWEVTYWNKEAENLALVKRETIINENIWNHLPEAKKLLFYTKFNEAKDKNVKVGFEEYFELLGKWFDLSAYPGKEGLSVYFRDVTEKKKIDEQIRIAKERYDLVARATREAVYDWNILENHLEWSDVYYNIYDYDKTGKFETLENWEKNLHPEDREEVVDHLMKCVNSTKVKWEREYRLIKKNKQIASVLERGFIVRDETGQAVRMIGALQDITEIKQNEIALEELNFQLQKHAGDLAVSNAELEQFAYIASHDLQEPLRMVTSFLTQLQRKYNDQLDDKARQYIHFATDGAVRMRQIILDLLEYSRVGKLDYNFEKIDLNVMLQEISQLHKNLILERSATIKYDNLPVINAAVTPLQRVLSNLITNSIKYNQEKPIIQIRALEKPKHWQIDLKDNGIGIDKQFQEKIFIIFQRLHSREQYSGTGMGLAICKKIIENHGGKIWVTSKEGAGSTFHFTILKQF